MFGYRDGIDAFADGAMAVWAPFPAEGEDPAPSTGTHMINFSFDDPDGVLAWAAA